MPPVVMEAEGETAYAAMLEIGLCRAPNYTEIL